MEMIPSDCLSVCLSVSHTHTHAHTLYCSGTLGALWEYYQRDPRGCAHVWLSAETDHYNSSEGDKGWGCGYRNLQMLLSALQRIQVFADCLTGTKLPLAPVCVPPDTAPLKVVKEVKDLSMGFSAIHSPVRFFLLAPNSTYCILLFKISPIFFLSCNFNHLII